MREVADFPHLLAYLSYILYVFWVRRIPILIQINSDSHVWFECGFHSLHQDILFSQSTAFI